MPATILDGTATAVVIRSELTERVAAPLLQDVVLAERDTASSVRP